MSAISEQLRKVLRYQTDELRELRRDRREFQRKITKTQADEIKLLVAIKETEELIRKLSGEDDGIDTND